MKSMEARADTQEQRFPVSTCHERNFGDVGSGIKHEHLFYTGISGESDLRDILANRRRSRRFLPVNPGVFVFHDGTPRIVRVGDKEEVICVLYSEGEADYSPSSNMRTVDTTDPIYLEEEEVRKREDRIRGGGIW